MFRVYYLTALTMTDHFIIRKNKSLKELGAEPYHHKPHRNAQAKENGPKNHQKMIYLEPLLKTRDTPYRHHEKMDFKLDYTQPVSIKSITLGTNHTREDPFHLEPMEVNIVDKHSCFEKENRPASMNEIKYPSIQKIKPNFYETQKIESLKVLTQVNLNTSKESQRRKYEAEDKRQLNQEMYCKVKLLKESSRSKLAKLYKDQNECKIQPQLQRQKSFRKGIIQKIVQNKRKNYNENAQQPRKEPTVKTEMENKSVEKRQSNAGFGSPIKKDEAIYWGNCSTIKEQEQSCQSFVSKNPFQEQESQKCFNFQSNFNEDKTVFSRRPKLKLEVQKLRKKFPHNFFK